MQALPDFGDGGRRRYVFGFLPQDRRFFDPELGSCLMHTTLFSRPMFRKSLNIINTTSPSGIIDRLD
jgi:hypothetical protein